MIADIDDLIEKTTPLLGSTPTKISTEAMERAAEMSVFELGVTLPLTSSFLEYWLTERLKRNVLYVLVIDASLKFQYDKIHLEHKFNQLFKLVAMLDDSFAKAIEENPLLFPSNTGIGGSDMFLYIAPRFAKTFEIGWL